VSFYSKRKLNNNQKECNQINVNNNIYVNERLRKRKCFAEKELENLSIESCGSNDNNRFNNHMITIYNDYLNYLVKLFYESQQYPINCKKFIQNIDQMEKGKKENFSIEALLANNK
jgi:hypothetical protein